MPVKENFRCDYVMDKNRKKIRAHAGSDHDVQGAVSVGFGQSGRLKCRKPGPSKTYQRDELRAVFQQPAHRLENLITRRGDPGWTWGRCNITGFMPNIAISPTCTASPQHVPERISPTAGPSHDGPNNNLIGIENFLRLQKDNQSPQHAVLLGMSGATIGHGL